MAAAGAAARGGLERELGARGYGHQHLLLAVNQRGSVVAGVLESVAVGDGIGGTSLDAVSAKDAAVVVDVIDLGVALPAADTQLPGVFGGLDIDAVGRAGRGAQEAGHTLFQTILVALQLMHAAVALLEFGRRLGVILG